MDVVHQNKTLQYLRWCCITEDVNFFPCITVITVFEIGRRIPPVFVGLHVYKNYASLFIRCPSGKESHIEQ